MAKTKFLDYTGLAKLVEKIKNTYVNIGGSTMTGTLKTLENQPAINFRPNNSGYSVTLNYDTESAEALAINLKNPATSFMINSGVDGTTWTGEGHQSKVTPTIQVRKNCVTINKYIADNITPEYKLDVNGDVKANSFTGKLNGNANTASKLGTATVGGATKPMYLNGGTPTECTYTLAQNVTSASKLTDTTYSASTGLSLSKDNKFSINAATSSTIGGVKIGSGITVDTGGTISLTKTNVTNALGYTPPKADTNTTYTFTSGTGGTFTVKASNSTKAQTISVGKTASASTADNAVNAQTAETANKLSVNAGSDMTPIYFKDGVPKPCDSTLGVNINGRANHASLADKLPVKGGSVDINNVLVIGNYSGGPIHMGGGIGPGEFTPTDIIKYDGDYYLLNVSKANTANSATTAGTANTASKLSVDGGNTSTNEVLVLGNYTNSTFTPSGIVSMITDPDIENEIKKAIVWPTA